MDLQHYTVFKYSYIESDKVAAPVVRSVRVLDQLRERIRYLHYSLQIEKAYLYWARFFICWHGRNGSMRHPSTGPQMDEFHWPSARAQACACRTHGATGAIGVGLDGRG
jgi:hypothetical protein